MLKQLWLCGQSKENTDSEAVAHLVVIAYVLLLETIRQRMITLHSERGGAQRFMIVGPRADWEGLRTLTARLLAARNEDKPLQLLNNHPWVLADGTNVFDDDFAVLFLEVPAEEYVELAALESDPDTRNAASKLAHRIQEAAGPHVRFVAIGASRIDSPELVPEPEIRSSRGTAEEALRDARNLLEASGAARAVDRVHTAIHAYVNDVLRESGLQENGSLTSAYRSLRDEHPAFQGDSAQDDRMRRILQATSMSFPAKVDPCSRSRLTRLSVVIPCISFRGTVAVHCISFP